MNYDDRMVYLKNTHTELKKELRKAVSDKADATTISELKKQKLHIKDQLDRMTKLDMQGKEFK